jgi:hypothetical protein
VGVGVKTAVQAVGERKPVHLHLFSSNGRIMPGTDRVKRFAAILEKGFPGIGINKFLADDAIPTAQISSLS